MVEADIYFEKERNTKERNKHLQACFICSAQNTYHDRESLKPCYTAPPQPYTKHSIAYCFVFICYFVFKRKQFKGARSFTLIVDGETALVSTRMGFSGYQYRIHGKNSKLISWVCVKRQKQ